MDAIKSDTVKTVGGGGTVMGWPSPRYWGKKKKTVFYLQFENLRISARLVPFRPVRRVHRRQTCLNSKNKIQKATLNEWTVFSETDFKRDMNRVNPTGAWLYNRVLFSSSVCVALVSKHRPRRLWRYFRRARLLSSRHGRIPDGLSITRGRRTLGAQKR